MRNMLRYSLGLVCLLATGAVTRIEVLERADYLDGRSFGTAGAYEVLRARAYFEADPNLAANKIIVDIGLAPKNENGKVEWSADWYILKPRDSSKGNGTLLFEVSNRGGRGLLNMFQRENDHLLMERGFTLVWCGWQWDIPEANKDGLRLFAPIATDNGKKIQGLVRAEFVPNERTAKMWLGDRNHVPYPVISGAKLTMRATADGERQSIPAIAWKTVDHGQAVEMAAGFQPGRIYELIYTSEDPRIAGLGPASVRDTVSFFKNGGGGMMLTDQPRFIKRAISFGTSQSGRFLRKFLYDGFNADEKGKQVFDGVWAHVAGAGRGSFNHRFAQASRDGQPMMNLFYPSDLFPFTDDQLLKKAREANVVPKIFYTNGSYEYWGRAAALTHITPDGTADAPLAPNSREYFLTGTQHGAGQFPPPHAAGTEYPANSNDYRFAMRGLLIAMNAWLTTGKEPPKSAYPTIAAGSLIGFDKIKFPIAGVKAPANPHRAYPLNFGPEFEASGIVTKEPPELGKAFPVLVPQVDDNGNEIAGIRLPQVAAPLATYTGWNYRTKAVGASGEIYAMIGSTFPFSKEKAAQLYKDQSDYNAKTLAAARALVTQGYLLEIDVMEILDRAAMQWDKMSSVR